MIIVLITLLVLMIAGYLIKKKVEIKWVMFFSGILLMICAIFLHIPLLTEEKSSGVPFFDVFKLIGEVFTKQLTGASFILMLLFGYTAFMREIGANQMTVYLFSRPLSRLKYKALLIPFFYLIGNVLGLMIPSASSLSVLLMTTAYPILVSAGVSPLSVGAVIAMAATIAPTPLGADNILAADALSMDVGTYVFDYHAKVSLPVILILAVIHFFWQRFCDKREQASGFSFKSEIIESGVGATCVPRFYAILPMLPLIILIIFNVILKKVNVGMVEVTLCSFVLAILCEVIRKRSIQHGFESIQCFFDGMGVGLTTVVIQVIAAMTFVEGLKVIGVIDFLTGEIHQLAGASFILMLFFCLLALGIGLLSGSGLALFYACVEFMPSFAPFVNPLMLAIPMQFVSHLVKSISPVSPTVIIISSMLKVAPYRLVKRTIVPSIIGMILSMLLSYLLF